MSHILRDAIKEINRTAVLCSSVGTLALLGMAAGAYGQAGAGEVVEEIEVIGIRASLQQNINMKRFSNSIVDAITSEDVGKFPDKNVAESLQRVPGVTIQRQFGEGAAVSIRGAGQDLTLTTLNGQNVASTGWFVLEPAKRSFNYELLPSELVGNVQVYKSSQADLAEGGVGGTVVVNTRKPLDLDSLTLHGSIEGQHQTDSEEIDPQFSGMASWKNEQENFGVLVSAVQQERSLQRQGNEAFWQWGAGPVAFEQERKRSAYTAAIQFRPTDSLDMVFNAMNMEMEADNTNYALWLTQADCGWGQVPPGEEGHSPQCYSGMGETTHWLDRGHLNTDGNGVPVAGPLYSAFYQARPREATMKSEVYDLKTTYAGEGFELSVQVGKTTSSGGTDFEMVVDDGTGGTLIPGGTYDFTGNDQSWDTNGFDIAAYNPGSLEMGTGSNFNRTPKTDDESYIQSDIEFDVEFGPIKAIKTGLKYADHNTTSRRFDFLQASDFNPVISTADISDGTIEVGAGSYKIFHVDADALKNWAKSSIIGQREDLGSYSEIDEENTAAYVMATFETNSIRGNIGVRYVTTEATSTFYLDEVKTEVDGDYSEILPSLNVIFDLREDLILRTSAARVMARPQYVDMYVNPNVTGADDDIRDNQFWILGNVDLEPFVADQFDISMEWYFAEGSLLSAGVFYKDVKNFVTFQNSHAETDEIPFGGILRPDEIEAGWTVQQKSNGKDASIQGFEFQYQQDFANGFGAIVNYTYTDTDTDADTFPDNNPFLSDSSEHSYNLTGYFENDLFQARLAYNWRSEYMLRETGSYGNRLHDDFGSLDLTAAWFATDHIEVKLTVNNLLEEGSEQFGNNQFADANGFAEGFPLFEYEMARRISLGANFKF